MKLTEDESGRISCAELFRPGGVFDATRQPDGSVLVVELGEKEAAVVKPVRTGEDS